MLPPRLFEVTRNRCRCDESVLSALIAASEYLALPEVALGQMATVITAYPLFCGPTLCKVNWESRLSWNLDVENDERFSKRGPPILRARLGEERTLHRDQGPVHGRAKPG